jgi:peptidase E
MMEMDAKEELVEVKNVPESEGLNHATPAAVPEDMDEAVPEQDYSNFSKKDFIDLLKELAHQPDFRKIDSVLKVIRSHYDDNLDKERSLALNKFISDGGSPDDFEFRLDPLDVAFEANYKLLRDRKAEHFRNLEEQKNENFKKKNQLLEELRALVDGEDNKHSFDKFKEIQHQWKTIGAVPSAQVRPQWASYHALLDRFYDNRNIYFELKELDRKKNLEAKIELCVRAEKLAGVEKINDAVRELNELHEEYKHIGPVAREEKEALWERFKAASDAVYERRDQFLSHLQGELVKNLEAKEQIISEISTFPAFQSDRIKEWNQKTADIIALQKKWESIGAVPRNKAKDTNKRFWAAFKAFFGSKGAFFKKLDESRNKNLELKKQLVQQAEALKDSKEWDKAANELKSLQLKWKDIGPVPEKMRDKIFQEFKTACDFFFEHRRVKFEEADKVQNEALAKKEAICEALEKLAADKNATVAQIKEMQRNFQSAGFVPRHAVNGIKNRFNAAIEAALGSLGEMGAEEKNKAILEIQLESMKSDPDAGHKIHQREQILRKKISKAENDLATLKNNLEFFGRSKNAEKMKAEFSAQIDASAQELAKLKTELKMLKAAAV